MQIMSVVELCEELKTDAPVPPVLRNLNKSKMYFEFIHFGAISVILTFQIEQNVRRY